MASDANVVTLPAIELAPDQALALAQLIKRLTFSDVRACAVDHDETDCMLSALEHVRHALDAVGYSPR